jgi:hypothetical protein
MGAVNRLYVRARGYRAALGCWQQVDPLWPLSERYRYVLGQPTTMRDWLGLQVESEGGSFPVLWQKCCSKLGPAAAALAAAACAGKCMAKGTNCKTIADCISNAIEGYLIGQGIATGVRVGGGIGVVAGGGPEDPLGPVIGGVIGGLAGALGGGYAAGMIGMQIEKALCGASAIPGGGGGLSGMGGIMSGGRIVGHNIGGVPIYE